MAPRDSVIPRTILTALLPIIVMTIALITIPAHAFTLLSSECGSLIFNMTVTNLQPNYYYYYNITIPSSPATLTIYANIISNTPVEITIFTLTGQEVWSTQPSTEFIGTYAVTLSSPGTYQVSVYNPSSNTEAANVYGWYNVTLCEADILGYWLSQFTQLWETDVVSNGVNLTMAPMGVVTYGVMEVGGQYYGYEVVTDAVEGVVYVPSTVSASDYYPNGNYYGNSFSVQLNAYVVANLADGSTQYYWVQDMVGLYDGQLWVWDNVWNETTYISHLDPADIHGNGGVYFGGSRHGYYYYYGMPSPVPFGQVTLEMRTYTSGGSVIVDFYANGQLYDIVTITPSSPVTSASIVIAPTESFRTTPLDLELILAGYTSDEPYDVLNSGQITMSLYIDMNGHWVPPPSAWTIGYSTYEKSYSHVVPNGYGSATVEPGQPNNEELWSGTVVVTPFSTYVTTGTDVTGYIPSIVNFGNGSRDVLVGVIVNGEPTSVSELSSVPLGSLVYATYATQYLVNVQAPGNNTSVWVNAGSTVLIDEPQVISFGNRTRLVNPMLTGYLSIPLPLPLTITVDTPMNLTVTYTRQYFTTIQAPGNVTSGWFDAGSTVYMQPVVNFGNGTRLVNPTPRYVVVNGPMNVTVTYTRQYLVTQASIFGESQGWFNAGSVITPNATTHVVDGVTFTPSGLVVNGVAEPVTELTVSEPLNITVVYEATTSVGTVTWGLPALYATASMKCGAKTTTASAYLTPSLTLTMNNPPTYECTVSTSTTPLTPIIIAIAIIILIAILIRKRKQH